MFSNESCVFRLQNKQVLYENAGHLMLQNATEKLALLVGGAHAQEQTVFDSRKAAAAPWTRRVTEFRRIEFINAI